MDGHHDYFKREPLRAPARPDQARAGPASGPSELVDQVARCSRTSWGGTGAARVTGPAGASVGAPAARSQRHPSRPCCLAHWLARASPFRASAAWWRLAVAAWIFLSVPDKPRSLWTRRASAGETLRGDIALSRPSSSASRTFWPASLRGCDAARCFSFAHAGLWAGPWLRDVAGVDGRRPGAGVLLLYTFRDGRGQRADRRRLQPRERGRGQCRLSRCRSFVLQVW